MRKIGKRIFAAVLSAVLIFTMPGMAYAAEAVNYQTCDADGQNWTTTSCDNYIEVTSATATWSAGWYVVSGSVTIDSRVTVSGNVSLILTDGCELKASQGINVSSGNSLTVYGQSGGTGRLTATATDMNNAGIGGNSGSGGTVTINGGTVNATGGIFGAGIGGGHKGSGGTITVNGGTVTAAGENYGAGIGGGYSGSGGTVTINGGTVTATGKYGAGVGGGDGGSGGTITITGGTVTAIGDFSTGIGGGYGGSGGIATITGGTVTAKGYKGDISGDSAVIGGTFNGRKYYAVTFVIGKEDVTVPKQGVAEGSKVTEPANIAAEGFAVSWYTDKDFTNLFDFENTPIIGDITLYAQWKESTDYIAKVTIDGTEKEYTTLAAAWASLESRTSTISFLKNVTTDTTLTVSSGMSVTVKMEDGVTFTNNTADCFQITGGTLTLAGGTVIENGSSKSVVYAASGTLNVTGGTYKSSKGNVLYIDKNVTVRLSGGTFTASDKALRYQSHQVKEMLADGLDLFDANGKIVTKPDGETLGSGTYTVRTCDHEEGWINNGDGTHIPGCTKCGYIAEDSKNQNHGFNESGECTVCGAKAAALVIVGGSSTFYEGFDSAWASLSGQTGTIKLLQNVTTTATLTVNSGMDVTVEMAEGVTFANNSADCFKVNGGTLTLAGGTVAEGASGKSVVYAASGVLNVTGGTYRSSGNGLWIDEGVTVGLSGGTFTISGTALRYKNHAVKEMLADGFSLYDIGNREISLETEELKSSGKTYYVSNCTHKDYVHATNGDNTHNSTCKFCGKTINEQEPHTYNESGVCTACGAEAVAQVLIIDEAGAFYETIDLAWDSLSGKTGTISFLQNVTADTTLTVGFGMNVTVEMAEGVTFTNDSADCFEVTGGTLTLAGGKVTVGASGKSIVNATASGVLNITGGSYESSGNGMLLSSGATAMLSGGSFAITGTALQYIGEGRTVKDMLAEECFFFDSDKNIISCDGMTALSHGGIFTVAKCLHPEFAYESINLNGHKGTCNVCNKEISGEHSWEDGRCTVCGVRIVAMAEWDNGFTANYLSMEEVWNAVKGQTATVTLLADTAVADVLEVSGKSDITLKMAEGVTLSKAMNVEDNSALICIDGGSLTLESGTVQNNHGEGIALKVESGSFTISGGRVIANGEGGIGISARNNGNIDIFGGSIQAKNRGMDVAFVTLQISGGSVDSEDTALLISDCNAALTGGTFNGGKVSLQKIWNNPDNIEPELLPEGYGFQMENGWKADNYKGNLSLTGPISVKQIPFTIDAEEVEDSWYYGTEKTLTMNTELKISGAEVAYVWKNGEEILDCTQNKCTVSATTPAGSYTYICEASCDGYTLSCKFEFEILKSDTEFDRLIVRNGQTETDTFYIDEIVTVIARPIATGQAPKMAARMSGGYTAPTAGQMALYVGENQVCQAVDAGEDGAYTMIVSAAHVAEAAGGLGNVTLTARVVGSDSMEAAEALVEINVIAAAKAEKNGKVLAYYGVSNLGQAFAAENSGATVILMTDVEITEVLTVGEGSNIIFNGGAFTLGNTDDSACAFLVAKSGRLNITGGTITAAGTGVAVNDGELNISGGEITAEEEGVYACGYSTVTISDSTITGYYGVHAQDSSTVTITDSTITSENGIGVSAGNGSTVTISGSMVTAKEAGVFDWYDSTDLSENGSTVTITDSTIKAEMIGAVVYNSTLNISGGIITAVEAGVYAYNDGTVTISDGTITAEEVGIFVYEGVTVKMSGGTFTGNEYGAMFIDENGEEIGRIGDILPNYGRAEGPYHALYKEGGQTIGADAYKGSSLPAGTYTVKECTHAGTVQYEPVSDENHNKTCTDCDFGGNVITESHNFVLSVRANGTTVQLTQKCSGCGYEYSGQMTFQIPELVYGEILDEQIQWNAENLEKFTMLGLGIDDYPLFEAATPEASLLLSKLTEGKQLAAGQHTLKVVEMPANREVYSIPLTVAQAKLTIKANDQSVTYGQSITQSTGNVMADGICSGDRLDRIILTASTEDIPGGIITPSFAVIRNLDGQDVTGNYKITYVSGKLAVDKAAAEIMVGTTVYSKTYGTSQFTLNDVTGTNPETVVQYEVTEGTDVVSVSNGTVTILNAGTAVITVSLPETANYNAAENKTITVIVEKKNGYTVSEINKNYYYDKENAGDINLAALLPKDCGTITYGKPATSGNVTFTAVDVKNGVLSYALSRGNADAEGTITVTVTTQNYADIAVVVNIFLTDRIPVGLKEGTEVTLVNNTLTYGESLSNLKFNEAVFVDNDGNTVKGTLAWKEAAAKPNVGTTSAVWVFTPDKPEYASLEGMAAIRVAQAAPTATPGGSTAEPTATPGGPTPAPTATPGGSTPAPTATPDSPTATPGDPTATPGNPTATPGSPTPALTATPGGSTPAPTATPGGSTATPGSTTPAPTATPGGSTPAPTATPGGSTPAPTATPGSPTPTPTATPGGSTPAPTATPGSPTPAPTATPDSPTAEPTATPGTEPGATPVPTEPAYNVLGLVERFYSELLKRKGDTEGIEYWTGELETGAQSAMLVGYMYIDLPEFRGLNLTNDEYLERLYKTFMNRPSDPEGKAYWLERLDAGFTRDYIYLNFAVLPEFTEICEKCGIRRGETEEVEKLKEAGKAYVNQNFDITKYVRRCYDIVLEGREADAEGMEYWCGQIITRAQEAKAVAEFFVQSEEFAGKNTTDAEYVEVLYQAFFGRPGDPDGASFWLGHLANQTMTRDDVLHAFSATPEFADILAEFGL